MVTASSDNTWFLCLGTACLVLNYLHLWFFSPSIPKRGIFSLWLKFFLPASQTRMITSIFNKLPQCSPLAHYGIVCKCFSCCFDGKKTIRNPLMWKLGSPSRRKTPKLVLWEWSWGQMQVFKPIRTNFSTLIELDQRGWRGPWKMWIRGVFSSSSNKDRVEDNKVYDGGLWGGV